jgi:formiminoglutamase
MIFNHYLVPADDTLFYTRGDSNDPRLGDVVLRDVQLYSRAEVIIIGCPQDEGVRRNQGRPGASQAPSAIRRVLYRYPVTDSHRHLRLLDIGDIIIKDTLEETHDTLHAVVRQLIRDGKRTVILGGGNDISYPDCSALCAEVRTALVFNIDRHLDVRIDKPPNSGTPYRQLLEGKHINPDLFHETGINSFANAVSYTQYVESMGAHIHYLGDLREAGVGKTIRTILMNTPADGIFFGFDLDVVRAVEAPGVSDPGPMGLTAREVCEIADAAADDPRTRIIEITEVNPKYDRDEITSKLAANIIMRALARNQASPESV